MPIYEYYCKECDKSYETIQKVGAPSILKCGECDGFAERVMSSFSVRCKESAEDAENKKYNWKNGKVVQDEKWAKEMNRQMTCSLDKPNDSADEK